MLIEQIIEEVGYENKSYFHRIFKRKYGMIPNRYSVKSFNHKYQRNIQ